MRVHLVTDHKEANMQQNYMKEVICDSCEGKFLFKAIELKTETLCPKEENIDLTYYTCPHCGKVYVVSIENEELKSLRHGFEAYKARVKGLQAKGRAKSYHVKQLQRELAKLREFSEVLSNRYRGEFYLLDTLNKQE